MAFNRALIPLYINSGILNNLFAVVVQEFIEIRSISTRDQLLIHLKTPLSEISYDIFGKYIQGDLDVQIQNEFAKQRTEESISTVIVILKKLTDILAAQGLLKSISSASPPYGVEENDYVQFSCQLKRNPIIQNMINAINMLQVGGTLEEKHTGEETVDSINPIYTPLNNIKKGEMLEYLRSSLNSYKQERCLRYLAENMDGTGLRAMIPIKTASLLDNEDYLLNGSVRVLGKVVRNYNANDYQSYEGKGDADSIFHPVMNDAFFDYIDFGQISQIQCPCLRHKPSLSNFNLQAQDYYPQFEVLPIAIYI